MLRCSTGNVPGYSNFGKPILTSKGERIFSIEVGNIAKKKIDIKILVTVREVVIVRKQAEAH